MNIFISKLPHHILILLFFFSFSNSLSLHHRVSTSLPNPITYNEQTPEELKREFRIEDTRIEEFMRQLSYPEPTTMPQDSDVNVGVGVITDEDEEFFKENINRPNSFFMKIEPANPTEMPVSISTPPRPPLGAQGSKRPPAQIAPAIGKLCTTVQMNCVRRERCFRFIARGYNRRLNKYGRRMRDICRRKCGIRAQFC